MRVLVCPQEFKGSLTAVEATDALVAGVRRVLPDVDVDRCPLADGGPGTVEAVASAAGGRYTPTNVDGPLGAPVAARWARIPEAARWARIPEAARWARIPEAHPRAVRRGSRPAVPTRRTPRSLRWPPHRACCWSPRPSSIRDAPAPTAQGNS
ncbi:MAG TPA: glycerate kinase [Dehalococcoidia bacterium]|nr:glycerate kinase [Dehalococcoidia bacterium]